MNWLRNRALWVLLLSLSTGLLILKDSVLPSRGPYAY